MCRVEKFSKCKISKFSCVHCSLNLRCNHKCSCVLSLFVFLIFITVFFIVVNHFREPSGFILFGFYSVYSVVLFWCFYLFFPQNTGWCLKLPVSPCVLCKCNASESLLLVWLEVINWLKTKEKNEHETPLTLEPT